jgi:F-type H+-transporting ATPase subunit delta
MSKLSARYAKSLLELSGEKGLLDQVYADMNLILNTCSENHELQVLLKSPIVKTDKKQEILESIFGKKTENLTLTFIRIIAFKRRERYLETIAESFIEQYKTKKNILTAIVTSASGLDEELRKQVLELVKKSYHSEVELIEKLDKNLIGGFIIRIGDKQEDMSIARKLKSLYRAFNENPYIKEF